jgi:alkaline phosphatase
MKQVKTLLVAALSLWSLAGFSQKSFKLPYVMHSHNDYEQPIPFWTAYYAGAGSIEADIYLEYGDILVAHDREDIHPSRSLRSLYLDPIQSLLKKHNGWLSADTSYKLQLLIDLKSPTNPCIDSLVAILERYPDIIRSKQIQIVLSGSRPKPEDFHRYPEYILYDGRPDEVYPANISHRVPIISESFRSITKWNGYGVLTAADKEKLVKIINETHAKGKKIRFWGAPDFINAWYELGKLGIDFMNTDNLHELSKFMARFQQTSFRNTANAGAIYKPTYKSDGSKKPAKNVILLIGDGMGLAHIHAGYTGNFANLNLYNFKNIGVSKTHAYDAYITDSAPGSSAFSTGVKTNNRAIGVDHTGAAVPLLPVFMKEKGKKNIIVATGDITDPGRLLCPPVGA